MKKPSHYVAAFCFLYQKWAQWAMKKTNRENQKPEFLANPGFWLLVTTPRHFAASNLLSLNRDINTSKSPIPTIPSPSKSYFTS